MADWNSELYLKFKAERTQPAHDLAARIPLRDARRDLIRALQTGEIGGAALDAVEEEPLSSDSPLWDMDNVIITPHCAADSKLYIDRAIAQFCENLKLYEAGKPLLNEIDMKQRY